MSKVRPDKCPSCGNAELRQDEDVLDTWFSSWLWPFSTLGWPKNTKDLDYFYPTNTLVTAPEIIFFWVARMIMAGLFCMKDIPFGQVYIHGTVRDLTGKKMSKSLGNIIDPLEIIGRYGTDALRYTLVTSTAIGQDIFLSEEKFTAGRNFANKLWNVTRYVLSQETSQSPVSGLKSQVLSVADQWILSRLHHTIAKVTKALDAFSINEAAQTLYDLIWHDYCDWYVELSKAVPPEQRGTTAAVLREVLEQGLRLLHPIMPFVTEELWQHVKPAGSPTSIMVAPWPKSDRKLVDQAAETQFGLLQDVVTAIRNVRAELNVPHDRKTPVVLLVTKDIAKRDFLTEHKAWLQSLAQVSTADAREAYHRQNDAVVRIVADVEIAIPLGGLIDAARAAEERQRIQADVQELTKQLSRVDAKLQDKQFVERAPQAIIDQTKSQRAQLADKLDKFQGYLQLLGSL